MVEIFKARNSRIVREEVIVFRWELSSGSCTTLYAAVHVHVNLPLRLINLRFDCSLQNWTKKRLRMATSGRRIGLFSRSGRKVSREEENPVVKTRKISREEMYGAATLYESCSQTEIVRKLSQTRSAGNIHASSTNTNQRQRKISVYSRPDYFDSKADDLTEENPIYGKKWRDFLSDYEPFILGALFFLFITVSLYIVFVEGESLFGKEKY